MAERSRTDNAAARELLAASEQILAEEGFPALTTRRIAQLACTNLSQINYYFGGIDGLIDQLLLANIERVNARRADLRQSLLARQDAPDLGALIEAFLRPAWTPAAHCPETFASLVIPEIYRHANPATRERADAMLDAEREPFVALMAPFVPHLDETRLQARVNFLLIAATSLIPRSVGWLLHRPYLTADPDMLLAELRAMGVASLLAPAPLPDRFGKVPATASCQRHPSAGATWVRIASMTWAL
jgi:AcrR family transcriptional regulator